MRLRHLVACLLTAAPITAAASAPAAASPPRPDASTATAALAKVAVTIALRGPREQRLRSYAAAVYTPGSSKYRQYLTMTELRQRFGVPPRAVARVIRWTRTAGFQVGALDGTGTRLLLTGAGPVGGTELATPIVASLAALAQARSGHPTGLIAPALWAWPSQFFPLTDITHVDAAVWTPQLPGAAPAPHGYLVRIDAANPHTGSGWDPVTGLGTPGRTFLADVG